MQVAVSLWYMHVKINTKHAGYWGKWRNLNSVITSSGTLNVRIGKYQQTTVFDNDTVISLLEGIFAMSTLPKF